MLQRVASILLPLLCAAVCLVWADKFNDSRRPRQKLRPRALIRTGRAQLSAMAHPVSLMQPSGTHASRLMNAVHQPKPVQPEDRELWNLESLEAVEYAHVRTAEEERQL